MNNKQIMVIERIHEPCFVILMLGNIETTNTPFVGFITDVCRILSVRRLFPNRESNNEKKKKGVYPKNGPKSLEVL